MPVYLDTKSQAYFAVCEHCKKQSPLIPQRLQIAIMLLEDQHHWCLTEDGAISYCCEEHLDIEDINHIEDLIEEYGPDQHGPN